MALSAAAPRAPCRWDATEAILKASLHPKEDDVLAAWARGYRQAFECFPRLHAITDKAALPKAARYLANIPNVSLRENDLPPVVERGGTYLIIQWHILTADTFTTAPYVMFFDVDAIPVLPLRCRHLFDEQERLQFFAFDYTASAAESTSWVGTDSEVFTGAQERGETFPQRFTQQMFGLDFMTIWPIVAPRQVLPHVRRLVTAAYNATNFADAWARMGRGGHSDLIAKAAITLLPERVRWHVCPSLHNRSMGEALAQLAQTYGRRTVRSDEFACFDRLNPVEHVKHPLQGLHWPQHVRFMPNFKAAAYAHELLNATRRGEVPRFLWQYAERAHRNESANAALIDWTQQEQPGRICGVGMAAGQAGSASRAVAAEAAAAAAAATRAAAHPPTLRPRSRRPEMHADTLLKATRQPHQQSHGNESDR